MALVHMTKSFGASTFGEMALKCYQLITLPLALNGCDRVDVFYQYFSISFKAGEREKRGTAMALEVQIRGPATHVPKQWLKYRCISQMYTTKSSSQTTKRQTPYCCYTQPTHLASTAELWFSHQTHT